MGVQIRERAYYNKGVGRYDQFDSKSDIMHTWLSIISKNK